MTITELELNSFLKLAYFIDSTETRFPIDFSRVDKKRYEHCTREQLVTAGMESLRATFQAAFVPGREHVVPLSGGLDSRLVLACLLRHTEARNLQTYTYGVPGSYDYELGCALAKHVGTRHVALPLDQISYHADELIAFAALSRCRVFLFYHPPVKLLERLYPNAVFWSGYVGDAVAGSYVYPNPSSTVLEAKRRHLARRTFVTSCKLHRWSDEQLLPYVGELGLDPGALTYDEQVLFAEAVPKYTEPQVLMRGLEFQTPLINTPWMDFMFSAPNAVRFDEALMIEIAQREFPDLFALPSKNTFGFPLGTPKPVLAATKVVNRARKALHQVLPVVSHPYALYNDFNEGIRSSPDLRRLVTDAVSSLKQRRLVEWIDLDGLLRRHQRRLRNHADALLVLTSLELILQAREQSQQPGSSPSP